MSSTTASVALENNYEGKSRLMQEFIDLKDNVKDQIFKLKQDIKDDKKKEKWDQSFEKINKTFNDLVERNFDNFINDNYRKYEKFLKDGKLDADETKQMEDDFNVFMQETFESDNSFVNILNQLKEFEQEATFRTTRLELNGLRVETESE